MRRKKRGKSKLFDIGKGILKRRKKFDAVRKGRGLPDRRKLRWNW